MAFHVSCPITCRRICYCSLGFGGKLRREDELLEEIARVEAFLNDPWSVDGGGGKGKGGTVQVLVPKVVVAPAPVVQPQVLVSCGNGGGGGGDGDAAEELLSAQNKRAAMQRKAAAASVVAEDYARRFESGDMVVGTTGELAAEEQGLSNAKVMCRLCFSGEHDGSERARKMLSCKNCSKKYHRSCVKAWAQNRDLFHWSSWTCPSCRICEVCRRTGDPNKLMFCKRCDGAYHCYCQQPPHKNVGSGPYLCPKHTKCHSCASTVPGNGLSVRWFLGYTCCDACGRLFVKGNYCPVCLKVYRDSESTPMVCCDICQRWVHCQCDGISDEKYLQFQVDNNLQYRCAACRGKCYQVRDLEDAVQELWRRRDKADRDLTASLRAAAGLPTQEEIFSITPYSDDEDNGPALKNEYGRSLKFSLKGVVDKSPKKSKEYVKKSANKKYNKRKGPQIPVFGKFEHIEGHSDAQSTGYITGDNKDEDVQSFRSGETDLLLFPVAGNLNEGVCSVNQAGSLKHRFVNDVPVKTGHRILGDQMYTSRPHGLDTVVDVERHANKSKSTKGPKLVIHLGSRNKAANSPMSDALREQELTTSNGSEDLSQQRASDKYMDRHDSASKLSDIKGENIDQTDQIKGLKLRGKEGKLIKIKKLNPESSDVNTVGGGGKSHDVHQSVSPVKTRVSLGKRGRSATTAGTASEIPATRGERASGDLNDDSRGPPSVSHSSHKELKPLLRLKFKNPYSDNQSSWAPPGEDDKSSVKGQRSKRKRPSSSSANEDRGSGYEDKKVMDEIMDANWIIQKLGKDAIGKKVEVHQPSNNSWHKGTVIEVFEGTPIVSVTLDDGNSKNVDLGKQGIRFYSQKQRR